MKPSYRTLLAALCAALLLTLMLPALPVAADFNATLTVSVDKTTVTAGESVTVTLIPAGTPEPIGYHYLITIIENKTEHELDTSMVNDTTYTFVVPFGDLCCIVGCTWYDDPDIGTELLAWDEVVIEVTGSVEAPMQVNADISPDPQAGAATNFNLTATGGKVPYTYWHKVEIMGSDYMKKEYQTPDKTSETPQLTLTMPPYGEEGCWSYTVRDADGRVFTQFVPFKLAGGDTSPMSPTITLSAELIGINRYRVTAHAEVQTPYQPVKYDYMWWIGTPDMVGDPFSAEEVFATNNEATNSIEAQGGSVVEISMSCEDAEGRSTWYVTAQITLDAEPRIELILDLDKILNPRARLQYERFSDPRIREALERFNDLPEKDPIPDVIGPITLRETLRQRIPKTERLQTAPNLTQIAPSVKAPVVQPRVLQQLSSPTEAPVQATPPISNITLPKTIVSPGTKFP